MNDADKQNLNSPPAINGIININKPAGMTSHDVVYRLRKLFGIKKIGHTGTLDPDATGVLPMCIGKATRTSDMLTATDKRYTAEVTLGAATDTQDSSGKVIKSADIKDFGITEAKIMDTLNEFVGEISQTPPMYSAIKVNGKKLYELAREGKEVERKPRIVTVYSIEPLGFDLENNKFTIDVSCSKGTYIRTLCNDIGEKLGCFAHMSSLKRTASGRFVIDDSYTLEDVERMYAAGDRSFLVSLDEIFDDFEKIIVSENKARAICNGKLVTTSGIEEGHIYKVFSESGDFLTISEVRNGKLKILKTFFQQKLNGK